MKLTINGQIKDFEDKSWTVTELLDHLGLVAGRSAVEVNLNIIDKKEFSSHKLSDGDKVEIVAFVGGG